MPFAFLVPAALAALAAIVVPIILHLRRRERERPTTFPSLMFLRRIPISSARRRRVTDWPLLLLRAVILALAVAAFAHPVLRPRKTTGTEASPGRFVLLLDRSQSMGHQSFWSAALDSARSILGRLAATDRVAVVAFDEEAAVVQPLTTDHAAALAAIQGVKPGSRATRYAAGLRAAREVLGKAQGTGGKILVITDLQRSGSGGLAGLSLPTNVAVEAVPVGRGSHGNTAITGVDVQRLPGTERRQLVASAQVLTRGLTAARRARITLSVNGREGASREATLPADGTISIRFDPVVLPVGVTRLEIAVDPDSLPADDRFFALLPAEETRRILLLAPGDADPRETLFLERALATGSDPAFEVERITSGHLTAERLRTAAAVFLYDVPFPGDAALRDWVRAGGGVVDLVGRRQGDRAVTDPVLPGTPRGTTDRRGDRGGVLGDVALEHPIFSAFRSFGAAALGTAHYFRYPRIEAAADAQILARFDDGRPALLERRDGEGRVLLDAIPVDALSGDFPLQPAYLPFIRQMALYAAGRAAAPLWRPTGDGWLLPAALRSPVVKAPSGALIRLERQKGPAAVVLDEAGWYSAYETTPSGDPAMQVAADAPPRESDLTAMDPRELLVGVGQDTVSGSAITAATLKETEGQQRLWRWLLLVGALALVGETIMASRGWRGVAAQTVATGDSGRVP